MRTKTRPCKKREVPDLLAETVLPNEGVSDFEDVVVVDSPSLDHNDGCHVTAVPACEGLVDQGLKRKTPYVDHHSVSDYGRRVRQAVHSSSFVSAPQTTGDAFAADRLDLRTIIIPSDYCALGAGASSLPVPKRKMTSVCDNLSCGNVKRLRTAAPPLSGNIDLRAAAAINSSSSTPTDYFNAGDVRSRGTNATDDSSSTHSLPSSHNVWSTLPMSRPFGAALQAPVILDFQSGNIHVPGHNELQETTTDGGSSSHSMPSSNNVWSTFPVSQPFGAALQGPIILDFQSGNIHVPSHNELPEGYSLSTEGPAFTRRRRTRRGGGPPTEYKQFGPCNRVCRKCKAMFWDEEKLLTSTASTGPIYHCCCLEGRVKLFTPLEYPPFICQIFSNRHFLENICAYNQMFAMTSLGATIDESVNVGRGPYVFKISGQIYHQIGRLCPEANQSPRFLQLYIYDTLNEVQNRLSHFRGPARAGLDAEMVQSLMTFLDQNNASVQLFRTARDKLYQNDIPEFRLRLFSIEKGSQYELPTADCIGAIVFDDIADTEADFDVVLEAHSGEPQRISKLHAIYMPTQFSLLFVFGEHGYHLGLQYLNIDGIVTEFAG